MSSASRPASAAPSTSHTLPTKVAAKRVLFEYQKTIDDIAQEKIKKAPAITPPCTPRHKSAFYVVKKPDAKK